MFEKHVWYVSSNLKQDLKFQATFQLSWDISTGKEMFCPCRELRELQLKYHIQIIPDQKLDPLLPSFISAEDHLGLVSLKAYNIIEVTYI